MPKPAGAHDLLKAKKAAKEHKISVKIVKKKDEKGSKNLKSKLKDVKKLKSKMVFKDTKEKGKDPKFSKKDKDKAKFDKLKYDKLKYDKNKKMKYDKGMKELKDKGAKFDKLFMQHSMASIKKKKGVKTAMKKKASTSGVIQKIKSSTKLFRPNKKKNRAKPGERVKEAIKFYQEQVCPTENLVRFCHAKKFTALCLQNFRQAAASVGKSGKKKDGAGHLSMKKHDGQQEEEEEPSKIRVKELAVEHLLTVTEEHIQKLIQNSQSFSYCRGNQTLQSKDLQFGKMNLENKSSKVTIQNTAPFLDPKTEQINTKTRNKLQVLHDGSIDASQWWDPELDENFQHLCGGKKDKDKDVGKKCVIAFDDGTDFFGGEAYHADKDHFKAGTASFDKNFKDDKDNKQLLFKDVKDLKFAKKGMKTPALLNSSENHYTSSSSKTSTIKTHFHPPGQTNLQIPYELKELRFPNDADIRKLCHRAGVLRLGGQMSVTRLRAEFKDYFFKVLQKANILRDFCGEKKTLMKKHVTEALGVLARNNSGVGSAAKSSSSKNG
ncbi:unnamed protein product [Amoebophrya sp. A120]|nr:unnamed protein product [Amoebophrya sp. A120]|eukprot:GSA120T00013778001.1